MADIPERSGVEMIHKHEEKSSDPTEVGIIN